MIRRILGLLLHHANSSPPSVARHEFYAMKERILQRFAAPDGEDIQYIRDTCWGCDGTGKYADTGRQCRRCYGTGVYREHWIRLRRWSLGGRAFHTIDPRPVWGPGTVATIIGRIQHESCGRQAWEAQLWLGLFFGWSFFRRQMGGIKACGWTWGPLLNLQKLAWAVARLRDRLRLRHCSCGRRWRQWFDGGGWCVCRACRGGGSTELIPF